ncbi:hypothetical protein BDV96DRAFT_225483 [Lophiotrema nucula]|uniref:Uncharacterized protein n=1 Tax=Lophiotrema nucula TaxID=690887 RepID=A0A6A5YRP1_9PLEO|nr:hypothetical protein BDV96DRAFT_225483 [Lophiotrema nucula]
MGRLGDTHLVALHEAAKKGFTEGVQNLLDTDLVRDKLSYPKSNVNPLSRDQDGKTALILATEGGHADCVEVLVNHPSCGFGYEELWEARHLAIRQYDIGTFMVLEHALQLFQPAERLAFPTLDVSERSFVEV